MNLVLHVGGRVTPSHLELAVFRAARHRVKGDEQDESGLNVGRREKVGGVRRVRGK